jgi:acyl phosphate:glycerol-3-phosphate acyltransferase
MIVFVWTIIGVALGSLPFSLWIGKSVLQTDIRSVGDGNPGGYNVWKAGGRNWAIFAILLDGLKGAMPVGLAHYAYGVEGWALVPVALSPLVGHIFSPLLKFHGGKGLSTTFGIWLGLTSWLGPTVFGLSLFAWRRVFESDRSAIAAGMLTLLAFLLISGSDPVLSIICLANLALVWWAYGKTLGGEH